MIDFDEWYKKYQETDQYLDDYLYEGKSEKVAWDAATEAASESFQKEISRLSEAEKVLRQIAGMKRKTKEQRLAYSCIVFLDSLANGYGHDL